MVYTGIIIFLFTHQFAFSQKGEFYIPVEKSEVLIDNIDGNVRYKAVNLSKPVNFFGKNVTKIWVYFDGVIGFDYPSIEECGIDRTDIAARFIAIYWLPNTDGSVRFFEANANSQQLEKDKANLTNDINKAFMESMNPDDIDHVLYVTWNSMSNSQNYQVQSNINSFQAVIVTTWKNNVQKSYVIFIYRVLSYDRIHPLKGLPSPCRSAAIISVNSRRRSELFRLSDYFYHRRDWAIIFSNEHDFQSLGRYTFQLEGESNLQPKPPYINCAGNMPDPFCLAANWFHVMVKIHQEFCLFREPGMFPYPLSCERFVKCGVGKDTKVYICPNGTNFNPIIANCDYKRNIECNIPPNVIITTNLTNQPGFTKPPPQKMLHNNTCILDGNLLTRDPLSCAHFLSCSNSQTIRTKCPDGLLFNAKFLHCDHPRNVNCSSSTPTQTPRNTTTSTTTTTMTKATIPFNICRILRNGLIKDPSSCTYFLSCSNGNTLRLKCPDGTFFNSRLRVCDHQRNVRC